MIEGRNIIYNVLEQKNVRFQRIFTKNNNNAEGKLIETEKKNILAKWRKMRNGQKIENGHQSIKIDLFIHVRIVPRSAGGNPSRNSRSRRHLTQIGTHI